MLIRIIDIVLKHKLKGKLKNLKLSCITEDYTIKK